MKNTILIIAGDFNLAHINWVSFSTGHVETRSAGRLLEMMFSHNLTQVTPTSQSLLDSVFISSRVTDYAVSVEDGISDHRMVAVDVFFNTGFRAKRHVYAHIKDYDRADDTAILYFLELSLVEFQEASKLESVEQIWKLVKVIVGYCSDNFIPTRVKKTKRRNVWISRKVIHMKRKLKDCAELVGPRSIYYVL